MNNTTMQGDASSRDDAPQTIQEQIIEAAHAHFSRYGYAKTTMADLAAAIGFSKAYLYRFFDSKQAIGEAICNGCLATHMNAVQAAVNEAKTAHEKLRALFKIAVKQSTEQLFQDRRLYDIVVHSCAERWPSSTAHVQNLIELLRQVIVFGRETGEFERKTPIDEVISAIWLALSPFIDPTMLQHNLDRVEDGLPEVINLVLRSLAP